MNGMPSQSRPPRGQPSTSQPRAARNNGVRIYLTDLGSIAAYGRATNVAACRVLLVAFDGYATCSESLQQLRAELLERVQDVAGVELQHRDTAAWVVAYTRALLLSDAGVQKVRVTRARATHPSL